MAGTVLHPGLTNKIVWGWLFPIAPPCRSRSHGNVVPRGGREGGGARLAASSPSWLPGLGVLGLASGDPSNHYGLGNRVRWPFLSLRSSRHDSIFPSVLEVLHHPLPTIIMNRQGTRHKKVKLIHYRKLRLKICEVLASTYR